MDTSPIPRRLASLLVAPLLACVGCFSTGLPWAAAPAADPGIDSFVLRPDGKLESAPSAAALPAELSRQLEAARDAYRKERYDKAERLFGAIADKDKNPPVAVQEAWYYRAECLRLTGLLPKACDSYAALLNRFPSTGYREQCCQRMYDIACFWLKDTEQEMKEDEERRKGKRWVVVPRWFSTDWNAKPFFDREGRAIEALDRVRLHDITGPLADQALYRCGVVKMYHENYREADHYFSQIHARHPDSKLAAKSIELAVFCKQMSTGGSIYDGRKTAEARKLIQVALSSYPELANDKGKRDLPGKPAQGHRFAAGGEGLPRRRVLSPHRASRLRVLLLRACAARRIQSTRSSPSRPLSAGPA